MDEQVIRAMQRWPNVPAVFGWLQLDRRGDWLIKTVGGDFQRITHRAMADFINRNYLNDDQGRWYFQNGPQRVFVTLAYTPWVYRLDDTARGLTAHTGTVPDKITALYVDDADALLAETDLGIGTVLDRDLPAFLARLHVHDPSGIEQLLEAVIRGDEGTCRLFGRTVPIAPIRRRDVAQRFRFNPHPTPPPGVPDC